MFKKSCVFFQIELICEYEQDFFDVLYEKTLSRENQEGLNKSK